MIPSLNNVSIHAAFFNSSYNQSIKVHAFCYEEDNILSIAVDGIKDYNYKTILSILHPHTAYTHNYHEPIEYSHAGKSKRKRVSINFLWR